MATDVTVSEKAEDREETLDERKARSWQARIEHTPAGLALTFGAPTRRLDMAPDVAKHLATLLAIEVRARLAGVVRTLEAENSYTSAVPTSAHSLRCDCDL